MYTMLSTFMRKNSAFGGKTKKSSAFGGKTKKSIAFGGKTKKMSGNSRPGPGPI